MTDEQTDDNDSTAAEDAAKEMDASGDQPDIGQSEPSLLSPVFAADPNDSKPVARYFSFIFLLGVIGLVGVIFYWVMARFLIPLFLAALLVVIFRPLHRWMLDQTRGRQTLAALLTTLSILLAVLVPIGVLIVMAAAEGRDVLRQFSSTKILRDVQEARAKLNLDLPNANQVRNIDARFLALGTMSTTDRSDLEAQSSELFEILEASNQIAAAQTYPLPEPAESESAASEPAASDPAESEPEPKPEDDEQMLSPVEQKWQNYYGLLLEAKDLQRKLLSRSEQQNDSDQAIDQYNSNLHDYREVVHQTAQQFDSYKYQLMGGRTRAFAIEFLNPTDEKLQGYASTGGEFLKDQFVRFGGFAGSVLGSLLLGSAIMIISLYFFLLDGPAMLESFKGLSPLDDAHEIALVDEFANVSRAVVVATLLSALAQGVLAGIGFYFVGLDSIFLLTVLSAVLAMVPFVGAAAVWIPCALYLYFFDNNLPAAIGLAIYGVAVISMADNFIKPFVLHGTSNLHPLLALLSVLGGVTALGPIGILIGPMVVVFLQTLLKILQRELATMDGEAAQPPETLKT